MDNDFLKASELCKNCGLCCSGALFGNAPLLEGEEEKAIELGIKPVVDEGEGAFNLPCPHLKGTACSIYPDRLHVCGDYHCLLSASVLEGETDFDEAVLDVESAKEQTEWLIDNAAYANLEGEDEYKLSDYQAHFKAEYEKDQFNLRYYQNYFLYKLQVQVEQGKPVSKEDLHYAEKTRDYIELIHESFRETSMLKDYSDFIESVRG
jgi:Fe-S-cluster containining protein